MGGFSEQNTLTLSLTSNFIPTARMRTFNQSTLFFLLFTSSSILASPVNTAPQAVTPPAQLYKPTPGINGRSNHYIPNLQNLAKDPEGSSSTKSSKAPKGTGGVAKPTGAGVKSNSTRSTKGTGGVAKPTGTGSNTACPAAVAALASGISANIADQRKEQAAVTSIGAILSQQPVNNSTFNTAKASLLDFVNKGIAIREQNQKIAPAGNAAIPGLATVANAQIKELNLTMSLDANDISAASATVAKLKADFSGGIVQNMKNLAAATMGCTVAAANQNLHVREQRRLGCFIYTEVVAAIGILFSLLFLLTFARSFIHWPVDLPLFVLYMATFWLLGSFIAPMHCGSVWDRHGIAGEPQCSRFKADIAFCFLASVFFLVSALLGMSVVHRRTRVTEQKVMRRRWYRYRH
ncbi:integral membrane protein [Rutstroemia sp. NJR-2017a BVV2]|nr:integral membrane protein [Rutstroemia sp. NJR-2017a BVV2]